MRAKYQLYIARRVRRSKIIAKETSTTRVVSSLSDNKPPPLDVYLCKVRNYEIFIELRGDMLLNCRKY